MILAAIAFLCATPQATDGDTIRCADNRRIRIFGIQAPELATGGIPSKRNLQRLINGGLRCISDGSTSYSRTVAICQNRKGQDIAMEQVKAKHAFVWCRYAKGTYDGC